jgi:hypothetical protein
MFQKEHQGPKRKQPLFEKSGAKTFANFSLNPTVMPGAGRASTTSYSAAAALGILFQASSAAILYASASVG